MWTFLVFTSVLEEHTSTILRVLEDVGSMFLRNIGLLPSSPLSVTTRKSFVDIFTTVRISDLIKCVSHSLYAAEEQEAEEQQGKYHARRFVLCLMLIAVLPADGRLHKALLPSSVKHSLIICFYVVFLYIQPIFTFAVVSFL